MASIATLRDLVDALTHSAQEENKLESIIGDLESFFVLINKNSELKSTLSNTVFDEEERSTIISDVSAISGYDNITKNFLMLCVEMNKFGALLGNRTQVIQKLKKAAGKIQAHIKTASSLTDTEIERLKNSISTDTGKQVEISTEVDPSLIGGMIARVENKVFDNSIKSRLERIKSVLSPS